MATGIKIYAVGGAGVNITKKLKKHDNVVFVDTSKSNLRSIKGSKDIYLVEGMDGAGKLRKTTGDTFTPISTDVLIEHPPSETLNVVIGSLSGGSGSVIGPSLVYDLLEQGQNVMVVGIYTANSFREMQNSIDTLHSYRNIAERTELPVCMFYISNESRRKADEEAIWFLDLIGIITDRDVTDEFDTGDLKNFVQYTRVTDNRPTVSFIEVREAKSNDLYSKGIGVISSIHISTDPDSELGIPVPEYQAKCLIVDEDVKIEESRIDILSGVAALKVADLTENLKILQDQKTTNRTKDIQVVDSENHKGLVL